MWIHHEDASERWRSLLQRVPDLTVVESQPARVGPWWPGFSAAGCDAVLLDEYPLGDDGAAAGEWWQAQRVGAAMPPVIVLARGPRASVPAADWFTVLDLESSALTVSMALTAAATHHRTVLAAFRASPEGREVMQFGMLHMREFRRLAVLATGRAASVYLAESERDARLVVIKVLRADVEQPADTLDRFLQEYAIVRRLKDPRVVEILDLGVADQGLYLVMEFFPYGDLRRRIKKGLTVKSALALLRQITEALSVIHRLGILHRDLKPANVMLRADGSVALIDFGLARQLALESEITENGDIFGTPYYMSPEQGHGRPCDVRSDVYSLGVIFHEMLTGRKPFTADSPMGVIYQHSHQPVPVLPDACSGYQSLLERMLAKAPEDRFDSAQALLAALDEYVGVAA